MTCTECKATTVVTAHGYTVNNPGSTQANTITIKKSMHKLSCSLFTKRAQTANMAKLPSLGNQVPVSKGKFTAKRI
jgi:hypothetical protein